jgi:hypothetical protein
MARTQPDKRRVCRKTPLSNLPSPAPLRISKTILATPRRTRLVADAKATAGNLPRTQVFKIHNVANRTAIEYLKKELRAAVNAFIIVIENASFLPTNVLLLKPSKMQILLGII